MHLYWPWPAKKTRQFSGEWLSCIIEKLKFPKWEASGSVATHNSAAQHSVSAPAPVYGQMMSDTRGSSAGGLTNKSHNKAEQECSTLSLVSWASPPGDLVTGHWPMWRGWSPGPGSGLGPGLDPEPSQLLTLDTTRATFFRLGPAQSRLTRGARLELSVYSRV